MKKIKQNKAITLIALIITIIVLLILAGVVINMTLGNDGIIAKSQVAIGKYENAQEKEEIELAKVENGIDEYSRGTITLTEEELKQKFDKYIENKSINTEGITFNTTYIDSSGSRISIIRSGNLINANFSLKVKETIPNGDIELIYGLPKFANGFVGSVYVSGPAGTIGPWTVTSSGTDQLRLWWTGSISTSNQGTVIWGNIIYLTSD